MGIVAVLVLALVFHFSDGKEKSIFGYRWYEAMSDSMQPSIKKGDLIIVELVEPRTIKEGEAITYATTADGSVTVTHRVISKFKDEETNILFFETQGDANEISDPLVSENQVIGTVRFTLPYIGYISMWIKEHTFLFILCIVLFVISIKLVQMLLKRKKESRNERKEEIK
ncbi:signal peptidase [Breznakia pachnodae]|uniref:Signal peptidase I n=2 Tax=Breznakia pachnodae TaxID=265178 RepID=A0ABU0DXM1_9FIRM|nr:signal peptidase [Breznakia pachnodae]